jgi:hypothetical protein
MSSPLPERRRPAVRSGPPGVSRPPRVRLLALLAARDEMRFLPGFFDNVGPQVDGVVALDDGSTDGSTQYLRSRPEVVELIGIDPARPRWDEVGNHRMLLAAALRHGAEWLIALDADERLERGFRRRAERVIARGRRRGFGAYSLRLYELWDSPLRYRVDGVWGRKAVARLFEASSEHRFDSRPVHAIKAPLQHGRSGAFPLADLNLYHLRMVDPADRVARRRRYERLDPEARYQRRLGYAYLTDEAGLRLRRLPLGRGYVDAHLRLPATSPRK